MEIKAQYLPKPYLFLPFHEKKYQHLEENHEKQKANINELKSQEKWMLDQLSVKQKRLDDFKLLLDERLDECRKSESKEIGFKNKILLLETELRDARNHQDMASRTLQMERETRRVEIEALRSEVWWKGGGEGEGGGEMV